MLETKKSHLQAKNLSQWLCYLETIHSKEIDLGLGRISCVAERLALNLSFAQVITVAGTNGKGTTCAFLESALLSEQHNVAVYSSPHITHFNERLRINKKNIDDQSLILAFEQIERTRAEISLSYYEYTTLAVFLVLMIQKPDIIILEVGLGGRLDATNLIDADIMVLTTIDIDHVNFLGSDRESIGFEKAGIMRKNKPVIIGDSCPPQSVLDFAKYIGANMFLRDDNFHIIDQNRCDPQNVWTWYNNKQHFLSLAYPFIPRDNVATALMTLTELGINLSTAKINNWIKVTKVPGRMEFFSQKMDDQSTEEYQIVLDVAHNPQAARLLVQQLKIRKYRKIHAVFAMMTDKDILQVVRELSPIVDDWYVGTLASSRTANITQITDCLKKLDQSYFCFDNITQAYNKACQQSNNNELVLVFGSFYTVAEIRKLLIKSDPISI